METKAKNTLVKWLVRVPLFVFAVVFLYPIFWNLMSSFKTNTEYLSNPIALPKGLAWDNYVRAFTRASMDSYVFNSLFVVAVSTVFLVVLVVPASYILARYRFMGSRLIEGLFMMCIFIQITYIMIPLYVLLNSLRLVDNLWGLCVVYAVTQIPFSVFLLSGYMRTISKSFEEAARIDGCSNWRILVSIIYPMAKSGVATVTMLSAMAFWNEYPLAFVLIRSSARRTLPIGLAHLFEVQKRATDFGALFAALVIVLIPTIAIYLAGQKYLLKGIASGGVKE